MTRYSDIASSALALPDVASLSGTGPRQGPIDGDIISRRMESHRGSLVPVPGNRCRPRPRRNGCPDLFFTPWVAAARACSGTISCIYFFFALISVNIDADLIGRLRSICDPCW